jgi:hypothetical protein
MKFDVNSSKSKYYVVAATSRNNFAYKAKISLDSILQHAYYPHIHLQSLKTFSTPQIIRTRLQSMQPPRCVTPS